MSKGTGAQGGAVVSPNHMVMSKSQTLSVGDPALKSGLLFIMLSGIEVHKVLGMELVLVLFQLITFWPSCSFGHHFFSPKHFHILWPVRDFQNSRRPAAKVSHPAKHPGEMERSLSLDEGDSGVRKV